MSYTDMSYVEVRPIKEGHKGAFAKRDIPKDTLVGCFDGEARLVPLAQMRSTWDDYHWRQAVHLKIINDQLLYIIPVSTIPVGIDYLNHSCKPNIVVLDQIYLYAATNIRAGEELTSDYRTYDLVPENRPCWCDPPLCKL